MFVKCYKENNNLYCYKYSFTIARAKRLQGLR